MKWKAVAQNGQPVMDNHTLSRYKMYWKNLRDGKKMMIEAKEDRETKSQKQCGAIFGCFVPVIRAKMFDIGMDFDGLEPSQDMIKLWLYKWAGGVGEHGGAKTLSKMDVVEAGRFIENIKECCVHRLDNLLLPELDPNWRDHFKPAPQ